MLLYNSSRGIEGFLAVLLKGKMQQSEMVPNFENRYGEGHKLS